MARDRSGSPRPRSAATVGRETTTIVVLLVACTAPVDPPIIDTGRLRGIDLSCTDPYAGRVTLDRVRVTCDADDRAQIQLRTLGWTSSATVVWAGTAAVEVWNEHHTIHSVAFDPCGAWDELALTGLGTDEAWVSGVQTTFTCEQLRKTPAVVTTVLRVYGIDGTLAECLGLGHDPAGLLSGAYDPVLPNVIPAARELADCRIVAVSPGSTPTW